ncbi:hypothetical protein EHS25_007852 [Saitozyma podzolica]|uniref:PITH domain-containing protein n=1 Tax=Saitozyma podzolica TaxID=1890683 RepID=A0A427YR41_9TREE|nr:hypothetical protein EHS25_007852 [Saitozyma podzolica]
MSCQDEAHGHDHEHDHGSHDHGHGGHGDHSHSHEVPLEAGPQDSLYPVIDVVHVTAMNAVGGAEAGQKVIKWHCESDADDTLILKIPFNASWSVPLQLKAIWPLHQIFNALATYLRLETTSFKDAPGMDFSDAEAADPTQVLEVVESRDGVEYQVKAAKFASISSLTLYIPGNASDGEEDSTRIYYVGLRGSWKPS